MKYTIIYGDIPWQHRDEARAGKRGAKFKYKVMTLDDLEAMRPYIDSIAAKDCLLALWWVDTMAAEALWVVEQWGFKRVKMKGFTWHKLTKNGKSHFGMGNWTRCNTEDCLFAFRGRPKRVNAGVRQFIEAPVREHSRKPDEARDRLVQMMGDVPRIELFTRQRFPGWDAHGDEVDKFPEKS